MARPRSPLLVLLLSALALPSVSPLRAEEALPSPAPVTIEHVLGRRPVAGGLPSWSWRPGHAALLRTNHGDRGDLVALESLDPVSGARSTLLDLTPLEALVPRDEPLALRAIGRGPPPRIVWNRAGTALVAAVRGDLVWVDLATGLRRRLTRTTSPLADVTISPDDRHVSFSRDHDLWVVPVAGGEPRPLTRGGSEDLLNATLDWVYPEEFGLHTAAWWSPDGGRLAWLQLDQAGVTRFPLPRYLTPRAELDTVRYPKAGERNPRARVGVVSLDGGGTTFLDLGEPPPEYVVRVAWFPDGERVAVVVMDRAQRHLRLLACPADGGAPRVVLEERDEAWVDAPPAPSFVDERRFLWRSHAEGHQRWYLVDAVGGTRRPATKAGVQVHGRPHGDPTRALYAGTPLGGRRARLWIGDDPAPFDPGEEWHAAADVDPTGTFAVVTWSNVRTPPRRDVRRVADGSVVRELGDARDEGFRALALAVPEDGTFSFPEGPVDWRLWRPADFDPARRHPLVVRVYGGPGSRTVEDRWGGDVVLTTFLTQRGFLVAEIDGRGTAGHGAAHERRVQGRLGVVELEDQARAVERLIEREPAIDRDRVGITGWSFGGTMACLALTRRSDLFKVGVAVAPVTDWQLYDTIYTERYMGLPAENPAGYAETAATRQAAGMDGRLLLLHGLADDNVHAQNTIQLVDALVRAGKPGVDAMTYADEGHGLGGVREDVVRRLLEYFERWL